MTDDELRAMWREAGGRFHGPNIETGTMPESILLPFLRRMREFAQAGGHTMTDTLQQVIAEMRAFESETLDAWATRLQRLADGAEVVKPVAWYTMEPNPYSGGHMVLWDRPIDGAKPLYASPRLADGEGWVRVSHEPLWWDGEQFRPNLTNLSRIKRTHWREVYLAAPGSGGQEKS